MGILYFFISAVGLSLGVVNFIVAMNDTTSWINLHSKVATLEEKVRELERNQRGYK